MTKRKTPPVPLEPKRTGGRGRVAIDKRLLKALASIGSSEEEICAGLIGAGNRVSLSTLKRRLQEDEYRSIWDLGRSQFKLGIRRLQFQHAKMKNSAGVTMTIHMSKHQLGETEKSLLELTGKNGGPIETVSGKMTPQQAAAAYARTLDNGKG